MKYNGKLYAKVTGEYLELTVDSDYVQGLEKDNKELKERLKIQEKVMEGGAFFLRDLSIKTKKVEKENKELKVETKTLYIQIDKLLKRFK